MPRFPRFLLPHSFYHIIMRGNNLHTVFHEKADYNYFLQLIKKYKEELPFDLYHYCLMPNHIHFLIQTKKAQDFSLFMKKLSLAYSYYYKKHYGWVGHFWQERYRSQPVGKDEYFIQCGKYIELNPVRADITKQPKDYSFSSYQYYTNGQKNDLITQDFFYNDLGKTSVKRQANYRKLIIDEAILSSYTERIWGTGYQRNVEDKKLKYHLHQRPRKKT